MRAHTHRPRGWTERLRKAFASRAVLLLYHRVARLSPDPWSLCVTPEHFHEHLEVLRRSYVPVSLADFVRASERGGLGRRAVVLTFDDGYADNLTRALPLLERHGVPATFFVVAKSEPALFWWDELQRLMLAGRFDSDRIGLRVRGRRYEFATAWASRLADYHSAWQLLRDLGSEERAEVLAELAEQALGAPDFGESHRRLTPTEVKQLAGSRLVEIGAHTLSHPCLPALAEPEQHREVASSKELLEDWTGGTITSFSYPFGALTRTTLEIVRRAKYERACTTHPARARAGDDPFALPRFAVADCDGDAFARRLADAFSGRGSPGGAA